MRRLFVILSMLLSGTGALWGQGQAPVEISIRGQVVFGDGRHATNGVLVTLEIANGPPRQEQTDSRGKFEFSGLSPVLYTVKARFPGYLDAQETLDLSVGRMGYVYLTLKPVPGEPVVPPEGPSAATSARNADVPEAARKYFEKGQELLSEGKDLDKSVQFFQKAIHAYPKYSDAYMMMGVAYSQQKKWNEATAVLQKTIQLDPNHAAAYIALGGVANLQGKYGEAEKPLLKGVELAPDSPTAHFELARAYWALGRWRDADPYAAKTLELQPANVAAHILMGNILLRKRDARGALKEFKESLRLDPKNPLAEPTRQMVDKIEAALKNSK